MSSINHDSARKSAICLVVAVARNGVIGEHNTLPWKLPSELKRFREITLGHPCIMGRKTWEGLKGPLQGRDNIVLTRGAVIAREGVVTARSLDEALHLADTCAVVRNVPWIMVIGGGDVYVQTMAMASRLYLTEVDMDATGDTHFPALNQADWRQTAREPHAAGPGDSCGFTILTIDRR